MGASALSAHAALDGHRHSWRLWRIDNEHRTGILLAEPVSEPLGRQPRLFIPLLAEPHDGRHRPVSVYGRRREYGPDGSRLYDGEYPSGHVA